MDIEIKLRMALAKVGMTQAGLARAMGQTPSNLNQKIKRGTMTNEELNQAAAIIGCKWVSEFRFEDGTVI